MEWGGEGGKGGGREEREDGKYNIKVHRNGI
jgi:hypothetical protein